MNARLRALWREPLVHFAAGALALLALDRAATELRRGRRDDARRIVVSDRFVQGLAARQRALVGRGPSAAEVEALVRDHVRDEALERSARALGLDRDDPIVRRRLVQKMEFVVAGEVDAPTPTDAALDAWRVAHADALREAPTVTFAQVYFARDRRGARAADDARAARAAVMARGDDAVALGDAFVAGHRFAAQTEGDVAARFGDGFAHALRDVAAGQWSDVIESPYGAHLVRVVARDPGRLPPLSAVRGVVLRRWSDERRATQTAAAIERLVREYTVVRVRDEAAP